eukprot:456617_1
MWHKILSNIASFATNNDYNTRRFAINALNKSLLEKPIKMNNIQTTCESYKLLFQTVLLPALLQLTKIENISINKYGLHHHDGDDLRLKLLTLIFQVFLHDININIFVEYDDNNNFNILW